MYFFLKAKASLILFINIFFTKIWKIFKKTLDNWKKR